MILAHTDYMKQVVQCRRYLNESVTFWKMLFVSTSGCCNGTEHRSLLSQHHRILAA